MTTLQVKLNSLIFPVGSGMVEQDTKGFEPRRVAPKSSHEGARGVGSVVSISQLRESGGVTPRKNFENLYANTCILSAFGGKI